MSKVTMPEPEYAKYRKGPPYRIKDIKWTVFSKSTADSLSAETEELNNSDWVNNIHYGDVVEVEYLITTDQAEAYKDACVREALEEAAKQPREYAMTLDQSGWGNRYPDEMTAIFNATHNMADRIRALIHKQ